MENEGVLKIIKGLVLMNVLGFRLREADFWNLVYEKISGEGLNIDAFKVLRLSTADELLEDEPTIARDAINRLSIERPDLYGLLTDQISRLNELIK